MFPSTSNPNIYIAEQWLIIAHKHLTINNLYACLTIALQMMLTQFW